MKLQYNNFALSDLGELIITQQKDLEGGEAPQRAKITLHIKLLLFERCYADNYALIREAQLALAQPNARLVWQNEDSGETYLDQTATLLRSDLPEEWGTYFQELNLTFTCYANLDTAAQNLPLVFTPVKGSAPFQFDHVTDWQEGLSVERFSAQRAHRREARGRVEVRGVILGDPLQPLETRRRQLAKQVAALRPAMNSAEGRLVFGLTADPMFDRVVRVVDFKCDINQAISGITYGFAVVYTLFPDEANYATCEATFNEVDNSSGEFHLAVAGKIQAATEAQARTKLASVLAAALKQYGYTASQQLELTATPNLIGANGDGNTFTELSFSGRWRRWDKQNQRATYQAGAEAVDLGEVRTWVDHYTADRFDPLRDHRSRATAEIEITGTLAGDAALDLPARRKALLARQRQLKAEVNSAGGQLRFGDFQQRVRVTAFKAEVNQAVTGIEWSLKAQYTLFPDEASYATCEATAEEKNHYNGELTLQLTGKIRAASEAVARAKLSTTLTAFLVQYGYDRGAQPLELTITPNRLEANADGTTFTELAFQGSWRRWSATNQVATFTATGKPTAVPFGQVKMWDDGYKAERFSVHRSQRRHATGTIAASGTFAADTALALKPRRVALLAVQRRMKEECNSAEGLLKFGDWSQVVRIDEFVAHINQAETGIDWAFTASYSLFPNEGGYATAEFTAEQREDVEAGDQYLNFAGEIDAPNATLARAKLASLRTTTLGIYGYGLGQRTSATDSVREITANADATSTVAEGLETAGDVPGVSFLRLSFNEVYRRRLPGTIVSSNYSVATREDVTNGLLITTYAGTVAATGATADMATAAALLRASAIGGNKAAALENGFLKAQTLTLERRQTTATVAEEFTRLTFSYEYQSKLGAGRAYLEVSTQLVTDNFGPDSETVSGFVVARDWSTAQAIYQQQARAAYATRLLRQETVTQSVVQVESPSALVLPAGTFNFTSQPQRLEFSFTVVRDKAAGRVTGRYSLSVQRDFRNRKRLARLRGTLVAGSRAAAEAFLTQLAAPLGALMESSRDEEHEFAPGVDQWVKLEFEDAYEGVLTEQSGLIEMRLTESVTYSGTRWAVQPVPFATNGGGGVSIPQAAGLTEGSRQIRGTVSAATLAIALSWAYRHRKLLTGDRDGTFCPQPEQLETDYEFAPRVDGIAEDGVAGAGSVANVQIYRVNFTFAELLPNYLPPA